VSDPGGDPEGDPRGDPERHDGAHPDGRRPSATSTSSSPLLDMTSGYLRRSEHLFPHQSDHNPWRVGQNYLVDTWRLGHADVTKEMTMAGWSDVGPTAVPSRSDATHQGAQR